MDKSSALEYINQMFPTGTLSSARIESMIPRSNAREAAVTEAAMRWFKLVLLAGTPVLTIWFYFAVTFRGVIVGRRAADAEDTE